MNTIKIRTVKSVLSNFLEQKMITNAKISFTSKRDNYQSSSHFSA